MTTKLPQMTSHDNPIIPNDHKKNNYQPINHKYNKWPPTYFKLQHMTTTWPQITINDHPNCNKLQTMTTLLQHITTMTNTVQQITQITAQLMK